MRLALLLVLSTIGLASASGTSAAGGAEFLVATSTDPAGIPLSARPGGHPITKVGPWTVYGSPLVLGVVQRHGSWLGVSTDARPNGHLGWVKADADSLLVKPITTSVTVDLSRRRLVIRERGRVVRALSVAVGRPGARTPTGRFAVTDKLAGRKYGSFYGCCVIALSGSAANGSRLAIHGGPGSSIGGAVSAGCLRARESDLRFLERRLRLGTPVFITK